jgi:hypothetical protein
MWRNLVLLNNINSVKLGVTLDNLNSLVKRPCIMVNECHGAQSTWHKEDKFKTNLKEKKRTWALHLARKRLEQQQKSQSTYTSKTQIQPNHNSQATNTNKTKTQTQQKHKWLFINVYTYQLNNWKTFILGESSIPYFVTNASHGVMLGKWGDKCQVAQGPKEQGVIEVSTY